MRWIVLLLFVPLIGCAGALSKMYYPLIEERDPAWTATVASEEGTTYIEWTSAIPGAERETRSLGEIDELPVIAQGATEQWQWTIRGEQAVEDSVQQAFADFETSGTATATSVGTLVPIADWSSAMSRLYGLTGFLLAASPPAADINLILVPEGQSYRHSTRSPLTNPVTTEIVVPFPTARENQDQADPERLAALTRSIAIIGMHVQHVALEYGLTSAPESGMARTVKAHANSLCWLTAARRALYLGSDLPVRPSSDSVSLSQLSLALPLIRSSHERNPDDDSVLQMLAGIALLRDEERFIEARRIQRPSLGTQTERIDSVMGFCRDYLQYPGNVLEDPIPLDGIPSASLVDEPAVH